VTSLYTDLPAMRERLGINNANNDVTLTAAITAATRAIEGHCNQRFWLDTTLTARTFTPNTIQRLDLISAGDRTGIGDRTGLIVKTDNAGDGVYEQTWAATDYQLLPVDAPYASPEAKPWTSIRAVGALTFPWMVNTFLTRLDRIQVTALWGWPAVPAAVTEACKLKAARLFMRKDSPQGVAGLDSFGPVRITNREDPDVVALLSEYQRTPVLVA
jgi:hypothetical protein